MRVCRLLLKVRTQAQVCVVRVLTCLVYSYEYIAHGQAVWVGAKDRRAVS
jgi:hypothetical protein